MARSKSTCSAPSNDLAVSLLCRSIIGLPYRRLLLLVDEAVEYSDYLPLIQRKDCVVITSRFDLATAFSQHSTNVEFLDLTLQGITPSTYDAILFRITKGKALVHHVINSARDILQPGQYLHLAGFRKEGIKTYVQRASGQLGSSPETTTTARGARCARITRGDIQAIPIPPESLPSENYSELRLIEMPSLGFYSKPGIYGWNKIDYGSTLLMTTIPSLEGKRVLDLGCGYGYLAIRAFEAGAAFVTATDNNAAAIQACERNFRQHGICGEVVPADCGDTLMEPYDLVLCNPPFHKGFGTSRDLPRKFLAAMHRLIRPDGSVYLVCNTFLQYEVLAENLFHDVEEIYKEPRFKVLRFSQPKTGNVH